MIEQGRPGRWLGIVVIFGIVLYAVLIFGGAASINL